MEIEFKYILPDGMKKENIFESDDIRSRKIEGSDLVLKMAAFYFDTKDMALSKAGLAFRVRRENDDITCTVKYGGGAENGLHSREEENFNVDEAFLQRPTLAILKSLDVYEEYRKAAGRKKLYPYVTMEYERTQCDVKCGESVSCISYDEGEISANGKKCPINELEIELYEGNTEDLLEFGKKLAGKFELLPLNASKLKRGIDLFNEK